MPVADAFLVGFVRVDGFKLGKRNGHLPPLPTDLHEDALKRARCRETYEEHATGKNTARPQLEACLKSLREGDTLVVWRLDRLGRNLADLLQCSLANVIIQRRPRLPQK